MEEHTTELHEVVKDPPPVNSSTLIPISRKDEEILAERVKQAGKRQAIINYDGNSFFNAVRFLIKGTLDHTGALRKLVSAWLEDNDKFKLGKKQLPELVNGAWKDYYTRIKTKGHQADFLCLVAFSELFKIDFFVITPQTRSKNDKWCIHYKCSQETDNKLYLTLVGSHFNALLPINKVRANPWDVIKSKEANAMDKARSLIKELQGIIPKDKEQVFYDLGSLVALEEVSGACMDQISHFSTSIAVYGHLRTGKSTLQDLLHNLSSVTAEEYTELNSKGPRLEAAIEYYSKYLRTLLGKSVPPHSLSKHVQTHLHELTTKYTLDDSIEASELFESKKISVGEQNARKLPEEKQNMEALMNYFSTGEKPENTRFILPIAESENSDSTTNRVVRQRGSSLYMLLVIYETKEEMLRRFCERDPDDPDELLDSEIQIATGKAPTGVLNRSDIKLIREVEVVLGKAVLFAGHGKDITLDRMFIRDQLEKTMGCYDENSRCQQVAVKEIILFIPSIILNGNLELLETPGGNDSDPKKEAELLTALRGAKTILNVVSGSLRTSKSDTTNLEEVEFFSRLQNNEAAYAVVHIPEKESVPKTISKLLKTVNVESNKKQEARSKEAIKLALQKASPTQSPETMDSKSPSILSSSIDGVIQSVPMITCYPLMFTSIILNTPDKVFSELEKGNALQQYKRAIDITAGKQVFHVIDRLHRSSTEQSFSLLFNSARSIVENFPREKDKLGILSPGIVKKAEQYNGKTRGLNTECKSTILAEFQALLKTMHSMWDEKITPKVIAKFAEHQMVIMSPAHINKYLSSLPKHPKEFYQLFSIRGQGKGTGENTAKSVYSFFFEKLESKLRISEIKQALDQSIAEYRGAYFSLICKHITRLVAPEGEDNKLVTKMLADFKVVNVELEVHMRLKSTDFRQLLHEACADSIMKFLLELQGEKNITNIQSKFRDNSRQVIQDAQDMFLKYAKTNVEEEIDSFTKRLLDPPKSWNRPTYVRRHIAMFMNSIINRNRQILSQSEDLITRLEGWIAQFDSFMTSLKSTDVDSFIDSMIFRRWSECNSDDKVPPLKKSLLSPNSVKIKSQEDLLTKCSASQLQIDKGFDESKATPNVLLAITKEQSANALCKRLAQYLVQTYYDKSDQFATLHNNIPLEPLLNYLYQPDFQTPIPDNFFYPILSELEHALKLHIEVWCNGVPHLIVSPSVKTNIFRNRLSSKRKCIKVGFLYQQRKFIPVKSTKKTTSAPSQSSSSSIPVTTTKPPQISTNPKTNTSNDITTSTKSTSSNNINTPKGTTNSFSTPNRTQTVKQNNSNSEKTTDHPPPDANSNPTPKSSTKRLFDGQQTASKKSKKEH